jgi:hypothetical protein
VSTPGAILAWVTGALGSQTGLLVSLMSSRPELDDLDANFHRCMKEKEQRTQKTEIIAFCEQRSTYFAGISVGMESSSIHLLNVEMLTSFSLCPWPQPEAVMALNLYLSTQTTQD